jgi:hypothetical protein
MKRLVLAAVAAFTLLVPVQALADVTALDPAGSGSAKTAAETLMADPATQLTSASLPEYAFGGAGAPSPIGFGDRSPATELPRELAGFPTNGETYAILSSGDVNTVGALLTNEFENTSFEFEDHHSEPLSPERGPGAEDWTVLKADVVVPGGDNCLAFDYRFLSEEFPEFVGSEFNDAFIAEVDSTSWLVEEGGGLGRPNDFASSPSGEPISVNGLGETAVNEAEAAGTYFDAATGLITTKTPITPGAHSVYLSIFDASDQIYDSAVFIDNLRFINESAATCKPPTGQQLAIPGPTPVGSPPPPPSNEFTLGPSVKFKSGGTKVTITVNVPGPGTVTAGSPAKGATAASISRTLAARSSAARHGAGGGKKGKKKKQPLLLPASVHASAAGPVKITIGLSGAGKALLAKHGKLTVPVAIGFTPDGGVAGTLQNRTVTFQKPHKKKHGKKKGGN